MTDYTLAEYRERSKHRLNRYALGPGRVDWANQPDPFRYYEGAVRSAQERCDRRGARQERD